MDETYIRVGGKWRYLWRAIDANGQLVDFRLTARRDAKAAKAFLKKAIERVRLHRPVAICTDKAPTYRRVIKDINHHYDPHFDYITVSDPCSSFLGRAKKPQFDSLRDAMNAIGRTHLLHRASQILIHCSLCKAEDLTCFPRCLSTCSP